MAAKKTNKKTVKEATRKQFFVYGSELYNGDTLYENLQKLVEDIGADSGDKVTILEMVGTKTLQVGNVTLV